MVTSLPSDEALVGIGSNMGDREAHIAFAFEQLARIRSTQLISKARVRETDPVGPVEQGAFLNTAARLQTDLGPHDLLGELLRIEREAGRDRATAPRYGPRTLDLDLLAFGSVVWNEPSLTIPHPRLAEREFVLRPLVDIAPHIQLPTLGATFCELLKRLEFGENERATGVTGHA